MSRKRVYYRDIDRETGEITDYMVQRENIYDGKPFRLIFEDMADIMSDCLPTIKAEMSEMRHEVVRIRKLLWRAILILSFLIGMLISRVLTLLHLL